MSCSGEEESHLYVSVKRVKTFGVGNLNHWSVEVIAFKLSFFSRILGSRKSFLVTLTLVWNDRYHGSFTYGQLTFAKYVRLDKTLHRGLKMPMCVPFNLT